MVTNGDAGGQVLISSGLGTHTLYNYNIATTTLSTLTPQGSVVGFLQGYGLALDTNTSTLQWSAPENFTSWSALDVARRNDAPDRWGMMLVNHKESWLFGSETTSVYYFADANPPFQPISSVFVARGIRAPQSAKIVNGSPMWLGQGVEGDAIVYRANGYTPERVSIFPLEYAWSQFSTTDLANADADVFQIFGHTFYKLTFAGLGTWVYDITTGFWFEEGEWNGLVYTGISTQGQAFLNGTLITGSRSTGALLGIGKFPAQVGFDAAGNLIRRMRRTPHLSEEMKRIIVDQLYVDLEVGIANTSWVGSDPHISLRCSRDGGQSFGNSLSASTGKIGQFRTRPIFRNLGQGRDWVFELTVTDPIPWRLIDAYLELRVGAS